MSRHGQAELAGIPTEVLAVFSKRSAQVEAAADAKVAELEAALGRPLEAAERAGICRLAVLGTRAPKTGRGLDDRTLYGAWRCRAALTPTGIEPAASGPPGTARRARSWRCRRAASTALARVVLVEVTAERATFAASRRRPGRRPPPRPSRRPRGAGVRSRVEAAHQYAGRPDRGDLSAGTRAVRGAGGAGAPRRLECLGSSPAGPLHHGRGVGASRRGSCTGPRWGRRRRRGGVVAADARRCARRRAAAAGGRSTGCVSPRSRVGVEGSRC